MAQTNNRFDFSEGSWEHDSYLERSASREPVRHARVLTADDFSERVVLAAGLATASLDALDCEDGLDEAKWDALMADACGSEVRS